MCISCTYHVQRYAFSGHEEAHVHATRACHTCMTQEEYRQEQYQQEQYRQEQYRQEQYQQEQNRERCPSLTSVLGEA
jgi:hypothetical protein